MIRPMQRACTGIEGLNPVLYARISTMFRLYSGIPRIASFYSLDDTAFAAVLGGIVTVAGGIADADELAALIKMSGAHTVSCDRDTAVRLKSILGGRVREFFSMRCEKPFLPRESLEICREPEFGALYNLLRSFLPDFGLSCPDRDIWLSDISNRYYKGCARIAFTQSGKRMTACALTSAVSDGAELISAVCSDSAHRGKGLGASLAGALSKEARENGRQAYIICEEPLCGYYQKYGFVHESKIAELIL